jgi:hypothetical protein
MASILNYHIDMTLAAVELRQSSEGSRQGTIAHIPAGSNVQVDPSVTTSDGMIEVDWVGRRYKVFLEDLQERGEMEEDAELYSENSNS